MVVKLLGLVDIIAALLILMVDVNIFFKIVISGALLAKGVPSLLR